MMATATFAATPLIACRKWRFVEIALPYILSTNVTGSQAYRFCKELFP